MPRVTRGLPAHVKRSEHLVQHQRPARVIAIMQRKGGVGKTSVMHHLAAGLVLDGYDVLAVEADDNPRLRAILSGLSIEGEQELDAMQTAYALFSQPDLGIGHAAFHVDLDRLWENTAHLSLDAMHTVRSERGWSTPGRFDYIPGTEQIKRVEAEFERRALKSGGFEPDVQLATALAGARQHYDAILIDSPPSLTTVLRNILATATHVVIPVDFDFASIEDYQRTRKAYLQVRQSLQSRPGRVVPAAPFVVFNKYNERNEDHRAQRLAYTGEHDEVVNGRPERRGALIAETVLGTVPFDDALINRAAMRHRSLHQYAPKSEIGAAYYAIGQRLATAIGFGEARR